MLRQEWGLVREISGVPVLSEHERKSKTALGMLNASG